MEDQEHIESTNRIGTCSMERWDMNLSNMQLMQNSITKPEDLKETIEHSNKDQYISDPENTNDVKIMIPAHLKSSWHS